MVERHSHEPLSVANDTLPTSLNRTCAVPAARATKVLRGAMAAKRGSDAQRWGGRRLPTSLRILSDDLPKRACAATKMYAVLLLARSYLPPECTVAKAPTQPPGATPLVRKQILRERTFPVAAAMH